MSETENTFCLSSSLILDDLRRGDVDPHEAETKLMDLGWCSQAINNVLIDHQMQRGPDD
jgi:hypothetical protein